MTEDQFTSTCSIDESNYRKYEVRLEVGRMAYETGAFAQAARNYQLALNMVEETMPNRQLESPALLGLAKSVAALGRFAEAEKLIRRALDIDSSIRDTAEEAEDYHQLSLLYWRSGRNDQSLQLAQQSWELAKQDPDTPDELKAKLLKHFAVLSEQAGDLDACVKYLDKAVELIENSDELDKQSSIYGDVLLVKVLVLAEQNKLAEAVELYSHAINVVEMHRGISHPRVHEVLKLFQPLETGNIDRANVDLIREAVCNGKLKTNHGII